MQDVSDLQALHQKSGELLNSLAAKQGSRHIDLGGNGKLPAQAVLPADKDVCPVCQQDATPGCKDSTTSSCCGKLFHEKCWSTWLVNKGACALCRMQHVPPPAAPADASDGASDSGGNTCSVCGSDETGDDLLINCSHDACGYWIHLNCNKITIPDAALNDQSSTAPQFYCPAHHHRCVRGDFKLEPDAAHLAVQAGRNIQAATQPAARAARLQARTVTAPAASGGCNMSWQERAKILVKRCLEKGADMPALMSDAVWSTHDGKKIIDRLIQELNKLQPRKKTGMKRMRATSLRQA